MERTKVIIVSEDYQSIELAKAFTSSHNMELEVYTPGQWSEKMSGPAVEGLVTGSQTIEGGAKIIPFPGANQSRVFTINEMESETIKNAIYEYKGNLTEAAKALGIGRATLYRKVKQYNLDPSDARKKRAA